ncbi:MAG: hypothetical protein ABI828_00025 [Actinomycetota bacterium]
MLEVSRTSAAVVQVHAEPAALDALAPAGATRCRIAPDEEMFVREAGAGEALLRDAGAVTAGDPDALIVDGTDGWAVWTLTGDHLPEALQRLSHLDLDPAIDGFTQGDVAHIPARIVIDHGRAHVLVAAVWGDYLHERIMGRCADLGVRAAPGTAWGAR